MASRIPAVHCVSELKELKWKRYLLLAAVEMLKMLSSFLPSLSTIDGICVALGQIIRRRHQQRTYHVNCSVCEVDEGRQHLRITADLVQLTRVPQRQNCAHELCEAFLPHPVRRGAAACSRLVTQDGIKMESATYVSRCRGTSGSSPPDRACSNGC